MTALRDAFGQRGELCQQGPTANTLKERAGIESIHFAISSLCECHATVMQSGQLDLNTGMLTSSVITVSIEQSVGPESRRDDVSLS
jgi:hypothetical protein